jgi:hypothetical protein
MQRSGVRSPRRPPRKLLSVFRLHPHTKIHRRACSARSMRSGCTPRGPPRMPLEPALGPSALATPIASVFLHCPTCRLPMSYSCNLPDRPRPLFPEYRPPARSDLNVLDTTVWVVPFFSHRQASMPSLYTSMRRAAAFVYRSCSAGGSRSLSDRSGLRRVGRVH